MKRIEHKTMYLSTGELRERAIRTLLEEAYHAREHAYAPYSSFRVGAALLSEDGHIYTGANVENASFGATMCAERVAVGKAISEGANRFLAIAVVGGKTLLPDPEMSELLADDNKLVDNLVSCPPCGICRQVLSEFCSPEHFFVIVGEPKGEYEVYTLAQLLPTGFGNTNLM